MTQKETLLLFKDLCTRLPYGVKINIYDYSGTMKDEELNVFHLNGTYNIEYRKLRPYLRPMSSMTEEESLIAHELNFTDIIKYIDWLNAYHFDYRGLIPMGLALEAPERMY